MNPPIPTSTEFPPLVLRVEQKDRYRFEVTVPGSTRASWTVDEGPPLGAGAGPDPPQALATAIGHCLSATLFNTLERAHVRATPIRTAVTVQFGRNERGRKRVAAIAVQIACSPLEETDRERFDRSVSIFEDFCTVTGAVRDGISIHAQVGPSAALGSETGAGGAP
jgi:organic hydroperoxide reductase OsmC/OhrA